MEDKQPDIYANGVGIANKLDGGKTPLAYIPTEFLWELGDLMAVGAKKYGKDNWRKGAPYSRYYSAALRHMFQWWEGNNKDEDTKAHHLIAAIFNLMACYTFQKTGVGEDDRQGTKKITPAPFPLSDIIYTGSKDDQYELFETGELK